MLLYLNGAFVGLLILSNILAVKLFSIGEWLVLPAAVIVYVFTFPITDTIAEVYGKEAARKTVFAGFITQLCALAFIYFAIQLPSAPFFGDQASFETIFSAGFRVTLASLVSYFISQNLDVTIFHKLKDRHGESKLWLRNNASTMVSQLVDTTIFIVIAFYGTMPLSALIAMIFTQYAFKWCAAALDTPLVYLLVKICRRERIAAEHSYS
ncbi:MULTISPECIES: queuosine precursor transporter [unclassified Planococcus (in: firmicutes)]|uniref:queuosine precursor transporter n=1 Tax=unclassified Planococcus (in: firmicutes) TaxID=2662419 RepID=UPI001F3969CA|nr:MULTISPECIES: queuosine precursor transporter [unclassified Planococcus (in: firmicutes)]UJF27161.1 queuosine precursor transporter [Planococcus sp. 107-1]GKW46485.1 transporter [Planococcus sp. NCCP-2050]